MSDDGDRRRGDGGEHEGKEEFEVHEVVPAPPGALEVDTSDSEVSEASEVSKE
jgi:hypothetical protein